MTNEEKEVIKELKRTIKNSNYCDSIGTGQIEIVLNLIDKLQKELEQERKLTNLIIDDFQAENYFINMTNKEVREYYSKRKELK